MSRIEKIKEMLVSSPNDEFLQHALALEFIKIGNDGEAENLFNKILNANAAYIGSYYHLAKLLERKGDLEKAMEIYSTGISESRKAGDKHAENELRMALEDISDEY